MREFFSAWATWEKLVFLLGCAIVVTILLGCAKLAYTHRKLRKYSAVAEQEKREQAIARQMTQRRKPKHSHEADVPFGIRALESGIEVEGVWISRSNTPEPTTTRNTTRSSLWDHVSREDYGMDFEKQPASLSHDRSASRPTTGHVPLPGPHDRKVSGVSSSGSLATRASEVAPITRPIAAKTKDHPPASISKYTSNPAIPQVSAASPMEGLDAVHKASGSYHMNGDSFESGTSAQSTDDSTDSEPIAAAAPRLLNLQTKQRQHSTDLDLMHSHRMSQAAETGQLTPRFRKPGFSGEWASIANTPIAIIAEPSNFFGRGRSRSHSPEKTHSAGNGTPSARTFISPRSEAHPPAVRRSSLPGPHVASFAEFCQTAPSSPMLDNYRPTSAGSTMSTKSAMQIVGDSLSEYMSAPSSSVKSTAPAVQPPQAFAKAFESPAEPHKPRRPSFEKRASDIVRGHGTGFEILKPGTFGTPTERPSENVPERLHKSQPQAPPISLHNSMNMSRPRSSSGGSQRKLQKKKRRPSEESETSSDGRTGS